MPDDFEIVDAHAVHRAMVEAEHQAKEREERMPSSSKAFGAQAAGLRIVRDKILDRLPPEHRKNYP